jgi:hypothetical protein
VLGVLLEGVLPWIQGDAAATDAFSAGTSVRVITPGSTAGEPLHVLSSLERGRRPGIPTSRARGRR